MPRVALLLVLALVAPRGAVGDDDALAEAARLLRRRDAALARAVEDVDALARRMGDGAQEERRRAAWDEAREAACAWIFDRERFPPPGNVVVTGPRTGYGEAKRRGDEAVETWQALARRLDRALRPALGLSRARADALAAAWEDAQRAREALAARVPDAAPAAAPLPFAKTLLELRRGRLRETILVYRAMDGGGDGGWERLCLFHALCAAVLEHDEAHDLDMERDAVDAIRAMNELRVALGISPLVHREELVSMARGHSAEMREKGYFSHRSPTPGRETKEDRARLVGYDAPVVECITGIGGGASAVSFWRYDGGHHRDMCNPAVVEAGFSTRGPAVYVGGRGGEGHLPAFTYGEGAAAALAEAALPSLPAPPEGGGAPLTPPPEGD